MDRAHQHLHLVPADRITALHCTALHWPDMSLSLSSLFHFIGFCRVSAVPLASAIASCHCFCHCICICICISCTEASKQSHDDSGSGIQSIVSGSLSMLLKQYPLWLTWTTLTIRLSASCLSGFSIPSPDWEVCHMFLYFSNWFVGSLQLCLIGIDVESKLTLSLSLSFGFSRLCYKEPVCSLYRP